MLNLNSIALMKHVYAAKKAAGIPLQPNHVLQSFDPAAIETAVMAVAICRDLGETEFSANLVNNGIVDAAASVVVPDTTDADIASVLSARELVVKAWPLRCAYDNALSEAMMASFESGDKTEYRRLRKLGCPEMKAAQEAFKAALEASKIDAFAIHCYDGSNQKI